MKILFGRKAASFLRILMASVLLFSFILVYVPKTDAAETPLPLYLTILTQAKENEAGSVRLSWSNYASSSSGSYRVEKKIDSGSFILVNSIAAAYNANAWGTLLNWQDIVELGHTYTYRVYYYDNNTGASSNYTDHVTAAITATDIPKAFSAAAVTPQSINLSWSFPGTAEYAVVIERKAGTGTGWYEIAELPAGTTSFSDSLSYSSIQYFYRIKVQYYPRVYSKNYPDDNGLSTTALLDTPGEPTGYAISPTQIYFSWTGVANAVSYVIERKKYDESSFSIINTISAAVPEYTDFQLTPDARYTYRIKAISGIGASAYSPEATLSSTFLEAPSNLLIQAVSQERIELTWRDNSTKETSSEIWKKTGKNGVWEIYKYLVKDENKFIDENIEPGEIHYYKIRARLSDSNTFSAFSAGVSAWAVSITAPSELQYSLDKNNLLTIIWKDNSNNESGFIVEKKADKDSSWLQVAALPANFSSLSVYISSGEDFYFYRVKAYDNTGINAASYSENLMVAAGIPNPPSELKLTAVSPSELKLQWKDNSINEDGFIIERVAGDNVTFWEIARTSANSKEFIDTPYIEGKYTYRVRAFNKKGSSHSTAEEKIHTIKKISFSDLKAVPWAKNDIEIMAARGLLAVPTDGKFRPLDKITKGELMSMIVKAFSLKSSVSGSFADVGPRHKYYRDIMVASKLGIALGDGSRRFRPDAYVSREDMGVFIFRTMNVLGKPLKYHTPDLLEEYSDKDAIASYALHSLASLRGESFLYGRSAPGGLYVMAPKDSTIKVEAALLIYRIKGDSRN